jgi:hypothetical protein
LKSHRWDNAELVSGRWDKVELKLADGKTTNCKKLIGIVACIKG